MVHDVRAGDVTIDEVRSEASVRATAGGSTSTWKLTVSGVAVGGQPLNWTDGGVSFAPGSDAALGRLNEEFAKGAEPFRSELRLVPGRTWHDSAGAHAQSGFLQLGHRPLITENNPGQKLGYSLGVVSARALYQLVDVGDDPLASTPDASPAPSPLADRSEARPSGPAPAPVPVAMGEEFGEARIPLAELPYAPVGAAPTEDLAAASPPDPGARPGRVPRAAMVGLSGKAAKELRGGLGLAALVGAAGTLAALRAARRQLALIASSREGR